MVPSMESLSCKRDTDQVALGIFNVILVPFPKMVRVDLGSAMPKSCTLNPKPLSLSSSRLNP